MTSTHRLACLALIGCSLAAAGCNSTLMHNLKPHRLWRLNRGSSPGREAYFSVAEEPTMRVVENSPAGRAYRPVAPIESD